MTFSLINSILGFLKNITLKNLLVNMRTILRQNGYSQIPQLSSGTSIDINNITIPF